MSKLEVYNSSGQQNSLINMTNDGKPYSQLITN